MSRLIADLQLGGSIGVVNALSRWGRRFGDPFGRLENSRHREDLAREVRSVPIARSRIGPGVTARYDVCAAILRSPDVTAAIPEPRTFTERVVLGPQDSDDFRHPVLDAMITKDGDEHARLRRLVQPAFTHRAMQEWQSKAEQVAHELIADFPRSGPVDLVRDWAAPLPMAMICHILGVPFEHREMFSGWGAALATGLDRPRSLALARRMQSASIESTTYLKALVGERRRHPGADLISVLASAEGERLDDDDIVNTASFLLVAGFETTVNLLSVGTLTLLQHPDQLAVVAADPDVVPNLVEEALRYVSPVQFTFRTALAPLEVPGDRVYRPGTSFALMLSGANRDPAVFTDPDRFDVRRANARKHLAFGSGPHMCLGAALARMEADVAWRALLAAYPDVDRWRLAGEPVRSDSHILNGLVRLPVDVGQRG